MVKKKKINVEKTARDFGKIFGEFGEAVSTIFKDSKLKEQTQKLGEGIVGSAKTLVGRFQDKEVKKQFKDVSRAAEKFGKGVAKTVKKDIVPEAKKVIKKAKKTIKKTTKKATKKTTKKKTKKK